MSVKLAAHVISRSLAVGKNTSYSSNMVGPASTLCAEQAEKYTYRYTSLPVQHIMLQRYRYR